ncbi:MAG: hypothetical protein QOH31_4772 [Verrucomicrobiota bacterium]|jgi:hypothetical protein
MDITELKRVEKMQAAMASERELFAVAREMYTGEIGEEPFLIAMSKPQTR